MGLETSKGIRTVGVKVLPMVAMSHDRSMLKFWKNGSAGNVGGETSKAIRTVAVKVLPMVAMSHDRSAAMLKIWNQNNRQMNNRSNNVQAGYHYHSQKICNLLSMDRDACL